MNLQATNFRQFLLLFVFSIPFALHAQNENKKSIQIGLEIGTKFFEKDYNVFTKEFEAPTSVIGDNEYLCNLFVVKPIANRLSIKSGVGYKFKHNEYYVGFFHVETDSLTIPTSIISLNIDTKSHFLYMPIKLLYHFDKNFRLDVGADIEMRIKRVDEVTFSETPSDPALLNQQNPEVDDKQILFTPHIGFDIDVLNVVYFKPYINFKKKEFWRLGLGFKVGKIF